MSNQHLSAFVEKLKPAATLAMAEKARALRALGHDIINLSIGQPDFDTPQFIKDAVIEAVQAGHTAYTAVPGHLELRQAICEKLQSENNLTYSPNQIVVSTGAKQSIANTCLALLDGGTEAILFTPYWVSYHTICEMTGAKVIELSAGVEQHFKVTPDQLRSVLNDKSRLIIFSSPCNPTGAVYSKSELQAIADVLQEFPNVYVIADEIYEYINYTDQHASLATLPEMYERTITVNGFSKGFAMTGWRLGYLAAPEWIAKATAKIQGQFTSGACNFNQHAAIAALKGSRKEVKEMAASYLHRRNKLIEWLKPINEFNIAEPDGAFYLFPDVSALFGKIIAGLEVSNADDVASLLLEKAHVACVSGAAFGNPNCIRFSYAADIDLIEKAVERIKSLLGY